MLIVKKSRIKGAGKGLFTTSRIRKGDIVVEYKGVKSTWDQAMKKYKDVKEAKYIFHISDKNTIDAQFTPDELARYANDAEGPGKASTKLKNNSEYRVIKGKPYLVATKNIGAGSEILVDYSGDYWEVMLEEEKDTKEQEAKKKKKSKQQPKKKQQKKSAGKKKSGKKKK